MRSAYGPSAILARKRGAAQVRDAFINYSANKKPDFWLWLGDNAYPDGTDQHIPGLCVRRRKRVQKRHRPGCPFCRRPATTITTCVSPITSSQPPLQHTAFRTTTWWTYTNKARPAASSSGHESVLLVQLRQRTLYLAQLRVGFALQRRNHDWIGVNLFFRI